MKYSHRDRAATAGWAIHLLASKRFKKYLTITKTGKLRLNRKAIKEAARYDGKWVLETNDDPSAWKTRPSATRVC